MTDKCGEPVSPATRFTLLGVGAMNSPRYAPVGTACGGSCSPTSAGPLSPRWTPGTSRRSASSERKAPYTRSAPAQAAAADGPAWRENWSGWGGWSRATDGRWRRDWRRTRKGRSVLMADPEGQAPSRHRPVRPSYGGHAGLRCGRRGNCDAAESRKRGLAAGVRVNRRTVSFCARPRPAPGQQVAM